MLIQIKCHGAEKELFEKYAKITGLDNDPDFYHSCRNIENDVKFFQGFMDRTKKFSNYSFEPRITFGGIYDRFSHRINDIFNYYDYDLLSNYIYVFEIMRRLFNNHWVDQQGVNKETVAQILEFHKVYKYYFSSDEMDYIADFIGSSYGIGEFKKAIQELSTLQEQTL
jgi:hypothetical protein